MIAGVIAASVAGYLLGSIPVGLLLTRAGGYGDIRRIGSGNIGATNVLRTGSKKLAALTLLLDFGKGAAAVAVSAHWGPLAALFGGGAVVLGHMFPVWIRFNGGKAVATALGVLAVLCWPLALVAVLLWLAVALATQYSSLAALIAGTVSAALAGFFVGRATAAVIAGIAVMVVLRHHANIRRLIAGKEPRISFRKG
jgi:acyl phosphate:glycerol-3-phosphate acyltransferase